MNRSDAERPMGSILKWLGAKLRGIPLEHSRTRLRKVTGGLIQCHDCGKVGHIAFLGGMDPSMAPGWTLAWNGLKPLYTCPQCGEKRRRWVLEHICK